MRKIGVKCGGCAACLLCRRESCDNPSAMKALCGDCQQALKAFKVYAFLSLHLCAGGAPGKEGGERRGAGAARAAGGLAIMRWQVHAWACSVVLIPLCCKLCFVPGRCQVWLGPAWCVKGWATIDKNHRSLTNALHFAKCCSLPPLHLCRRRLSWSARRRSWQVGCCCASAAPAGPPALCACCRRCSTSAAALVAHLHTAIVAHLHTTVVAHLHTSLPPWDATPACRCRPEGDGGAARRSTGG